MEKKIWLITGISSGLGEALADTVMTQGDYVIGTVRQRDQITSFNEKNRGRGEAIQMDVARDDIDSIVNDLLVRHGRIDVLVNNAGVGFAGAIEETSDAELREVFEVNFFGLWRLTRAVLPDMRARRSGHIIQISSHAGVKAFGGFGVYCASKFAVEGMSEAMAQELEPLGIGVTIVEPGPFRTNFAGRSLMLAEEVIEDYAGTSGAFRAKLQGVHDKQEGHPVKAAKAIWDHVHKERGTLRLPLGKVPTITIGMKIDSLRADLEANREIATGAVYCL